MFDCPPKIAPMSHANRPTRSQFKPPTITRINDVACNAFMIIKLILIIDK